MITVRWLTGELEMMEGPLGVSDLRATLRKRYGRNMVVNLIREDTILVDEDVVQNDDLVCVIVCPERELRNDESAQVEEAFRKHFAVIDGTFFEEFRTKLRESRALVAGGSVVCSLINRRIHDIDVYVNYSRAFSLMKHLLTRLNVHSWNIHTGSTYDQSFFRRNNIMLRVPFVKRVQRRRRDHRNFHFVNHNQVHETFQIDVIVVPDEVELEDVIGNFDLSFCESWWDGNRVFSMDADSIRERHGRLKPAYWATLFKQLNLFTIRRIKKYQKRGFQIDLCDTPDLTLNEIIHIETPEDLDDDTKNDDGDTKNDDGIDNIVNAEHEDWAIRTFYKEALKLFWRGHHVPNGLQEICFFFQCFPNRKRLTWQDLSDKWKGREGMLKEVVLKVFQEKWTDIRHQRQEYRNAFLKTFDLKESDYVETEQQEVYNVWENQEWQQFWKDSLLEIGITSDTYQIPRHDYDHDQREYLGRFDSDDDDDWPQA